MNLWFGLLCNFMDDPLKSWDWIGNIKRKSLTLMMDIWLTENSWVLKYLEKRPKYKVTLARTVFLLEIRNFLKNLVINFEYLRLSKKFF